MEKLTTTMKEAIKDRIDNITKVANDYKNIINHDYQFIDGAEESTFYFKFNRAIKSELVKIENILDDINHARNYIEIGPDFIDWADYYFQNNFNKTINREEAFRNYKDSLSLNRCTRLNIRIFIKKVKLWCQIKGHTYNPEEIMKQRTETERKRNEIRWNDRDIIGNTVSVYGFYIGNKEEDNQ